MTKCVIVAAFMLLLLDAHNIFSQANDAPALVKAVLDKQKTRPFWFRLRSISFGYVPYVFDVKTRTEKYDGDGKVKGDGLPHGAVGVFTPVEGVLLYTPLEIGEKPVTEKTANEWEQRREKQFAEARGRSEAEKKKIKASQEKEMKERAEFWDEFAKAFRFQILERKEHNGRATVIIGYTPLKGYKPGKAIDTGYLPRIEGQVWIDEADTEITRFQMEFTENVNVGFGLAGKVSKGTSYSMDLLKLIDGMWLRVKAETTLKMRQLLVTKTNEKFTAEYSNYRKFSTDSKIISSEFR